ncbi:MAG: methylated-DNA--[protein]-cysteine S-methyltransferase [Nitriliruptoraceae bacterium]
MTIHAYLPSPLGDLLVTGDDGVVTGLYLPDHRRGPQVSATWGHDPGAFDGLREQLDEYLTGRRTTFDVEVRLDGTCLQQRVWQELRTLSYGERVSYGQLAQRIDRPTAVRAVASAVARNPVSIVVPCHRVVGSDGRLTGYAGGVERKQWLLELESRGA